MAWRRALLPARLPCGPLGPFRPLALRCGLRGFAARDAYTVMGLDRRASQQEVKERFRVLAKQYHPDLNTGDRTASLKMAELTSAYDTLMDPKRRAALDQATAGTSAGAGPGSSYTGGFPYDDSDGWVSPSQMFSEFSDLFGRNSQFRPNMDASAAQRGEAPAVPAVPTQPPVCVPSQC